MKQRTLRFFLLSAVMSFILTGCYHVKNTEENRSKNTKRTHLVSLQALSQKIFDGRDLKLERVLDENSAYTRHYITYKSGELKISGIMNVPKGTGPFPMAILNHGHIDTNVYTNGRGLKREQDYLARRGFVVLHADYRNHAESDDDPNEELKLRLGYTEDVINAIYAVKNAKLDFIDTGNIFMLGHSMGGGIAIQIMVTQPELIDAYVLFAPVSADFRDTFDRWFTRRPEMAEKIISQYGSPKDSPEFWSGLNALQYLNNVSAPVMIHHGTEDRDVPLAWSETLANELKKKKKDITLHIYKNEPHEFINAWPLVMRRTVEFFESNKKNS